MYVEAGAEEELVGLELVWAAFEVVLMGRVVVVTAVDVVNRVLVLVVIVVVCVVVPVILVDVSTFVVVLSEGEEALLAL